MILKKYRIGPVGSVIIRYKRIQVDMNSNKSMCSVCGLGQEVCKNFKIYTNNTNVSNLLKNITLYTICRKIDEHLNIKYSVTYIPWKIRL